VSSKNFFYFSCVEWFHCICFTVWCGFFFFFCVTPGDACSLCDYNILIVFDLLYVCVCVFRVCALTRTFIYAVHRDRRNQSKSYLWHEHGSTLWWSCKSAVLICYVIWSTAYCLSPFYRPFSTDLGQLVPECLHSGFYWMMEVVMTTGAIRHTKLQSNHHRQQTNTQLFTGWMPFLSPNQQCPSTEWKLEQSFSRACVKFVSVAVEWCQESQTVCKRRSVFSGQCCSTSRLSRHQNVNTFWIWWCDVMELTATNLS